VLDAWWARQPVKPATPYIAALKVCERALQGGMAGDELATALDEIPTISGGALDFWRKRRADKRGRPAASAALTAEQYAAMDELDRRSAATLARLEKERSR
jgi:hypothetical protein